MARYRMPDGTVVDTDNASKSWEEAIRWDGRNNISVATGDQWVHQTLYRSRRGRYYIETVSQWQGSTPHAEWVSQREAVRWLLLNRHELPAELAAIAEEVVE